MPASDLKECSSWKEVPISSIGTVVGGGTPPTKHDEYYDGDIAWITPKDLSGIHERYISRGERNITQLGYDNSSAQMLPAGTVLFSSRAPIGYVAIAKNELCTNQGFKSVVPNPEVCNSVFLYYLLTYYKKDIEAIASGTTFMEVSGTTLKNFKIRIPDLQTQEKIASILSSLDDKIEVNNQINRNLEEQAFSFFDDLIKNGSQESNLSSIAIINPLRSLKKGVVAQCIDMAQLSTTSAYPAPGVYKAYSGGMKFMNGDTLLARITPCLENGKTAYIDFLKEDEVAFGSTEYIVLSSRGEMPPQFCYCLARNKHFRNYAIKSMNGSSGRQRVSADALERYMIPSISEEDMKSFGQHVEPLFRLMRQKADENIRLSSLRDTLLPKLMSGEINLS